MRPIKAVASGSRLVGESPSLSTYLFPQLLLLLPHHGLERDKRGKKKMKCGGGKHVEHTEKWEEQNIKQATAGSGQRTILSGFLCLTVAH